MKMEEIKARAEELGIPDYTNMKKPDLIRSIQAAEGGEPTFGRNNGDCVYRTCCWWDECIKEYRKNAKR